MVIEATLRQFKMVECDSSLKQFENHCLNEMLCLMVCIEAFSSPSVLIESVTIAFRTYRSLLSEVVIH